ncbi:hypothetical protein [Hymenobacter fodinae]|uniref:hypothetical protein n=1 Tax=Hymenobacter fodinae TaxID=2510796 RepID=UPI0010805034|nr:hypothetical protein [Hymenobacter fodinae]
MTDLKSWKQTHIKEDADYKATVAKQLDAVNATIQAKADKDEKWRAEIQETLTQIRIAVGARPAARP